MSTIFSSEIITLFSDIDFFNYLSKERQKTENDSINILPSFLSKVAPVFNLSTPYTNYFYALQKRVHLLTSIH